MITRCDINFILWLNEAGTLCEVLLDDADAMDVCVDDAGATARDDIVRARAALMGAVAATGAITAVWLLLSSTALSDRIKNT